MLISIQSNNDAIRRYLSQSKYSLICKHEKGLSKHEKGLSEHEKGLSDLNHIKMYREYITKGSKPGLFLLVRVVSLLDPVARIVPIGK